jgi:hypothetical protein
MFSDSLPQIPYSFLTLKYQIGLKTKEHEMMSATFLKEMDVVHAPT